MHAAVLGCRSKNSVASGARQPSMLQRVTEICFDNAMRLYFDFLIKMHKQYDRWHIYMNDKKAVEYEYGLTLHEL